MRCTSISCTTFVPIRGWYYLSSPHEYLTRNRSTLPQKRIQSPVFKILRYLHRVGLANQRFAQLRSPAMPSIRLRAGVALPHPKKQKRYSFLRPCPPFREFRWRAARRAALAEQTEGLRICDFWCWGTGEGTSCIPPFSFFFNFRVFVDFFVNFV